MKALTLHQPWATLMAIGAKYIETRRWPTNYRGELAIHAAKVFPGYAKDACYSIPILKALGWPHGKGTTQQWLDDINSRIKALPLGAIVGTCDLVLIFETGLITNSSILARVEQEKGLGNYAPGRFGWMTANMKRRDPPVAARGAQGLWDWHG